MTTPESHPISFRARLAAFGLLVLLVLVGAGNLWATYAVSQQSVQRVCNGFSFFITKPVPPINTPLKQRQEQQWRRLQVFKDHVGCG